MTHRYSLSDCLTAAYVITFLAVTAVALVCGVSAVVISVGRLFF